MFKFISSKKSNKNLTNYLNTNPTYIPEYIVKHNHKNINWDSLDYSLYSQDFLEKYSKYINFSKFKCLKNLTFYFIENNKDKFNINVLIKNKHPLYYKDIYNRKFDIDLNVFFSNVEFNMQLFYIFNDILNTTENIKLLFDSQKINKFLLEHIVQKKKNIIDFDHLIKTGQNISTDTLKDNFEKVKEKKLLIPFLSYNFMKEKVDFDDDLIQIYIESRPTKIEKIFFSHNLNYIIENNLLVPLIENNLCLLDTPIIMEYGFLFISNPLIWDYIQLNFSSDKNICLKFYIFMDLEKIENKNLKTMVILKKILKDKHIYSDIEDSKDACDICFDCFSDIKLRICKHSLCFLCFYNWFKKSPYCPFCRTKI